MNLPGKTDFIDIHNHRGKVAGAVFSVENLMAHEERIPDLQQGTAYTFGIHPWYLKSETYEEQIEKVRHYAFHENVIAIGEGGFDKLKGPVIDLQRKAFEEQAIIAEEHSIPLYIHCVRSWDELLAAHRRLKPSMPWLVHGFRGKHDLAIQLISRGMYLSFWFEFILRSESSGLVRSIPVDRIFLESDGSGEDIRAIYKKVSADLGIDIEQLKKQIYSNFSKIFN